MSILNKLAEHWLAFALAGTTSAFGLLARWLWGRLKKEMAEQKQMRDGLLAMLSDRLFQACKFHISKGYISFEEYRMVEQLYQSYSRLGGNGYGTTLYTHVKSLEMVSDEVVSPITGRNKPTILPSEQRK